MRARGWGLRLRLCRRVLPNSEVGLCECALFHACEPHCSNEAGACYFDPSGGPSTICRRNDDVEPRIWESDPNMMGDGVARRSSTRAAPATKATAWP